MRLMKVSHMWQALWAPANSLRNFMALCALTIAFLLLGFHFRPSAVGPAQIPHSPTLTVDFHPQLSNVIIYLSLIQAARTGTQAKLEIYVAGLFRSRQSAVHWTMDVEDFTGYICTPKPFQANVKYVRGRYRYLISGSSKIPAIPGSLFLVVNLCWKSRSPLTISGLYISAALPPIRASVDQAGTVTRRLALLGTSLSAYTLAGGITPTKVNPHSWNWTSPLSADPANQASAEIPVIGSNIIGLQHDNRDAFLSGIFLGIAGGAAVSGVVALLDVLSRRIAGRKPSVGAGSHALGEATLSSSAKQDSAGDPATSRSGSNAPGRATS